MSFFFDKVSRDAKGPNKRKRNADSLHKLGCSACILNKAKVHSPKMKPTLVDDTWIYFLGEGPGEQEDKQGKPFVGPSGKLLRRCITIPTEHCSFDNVVRDRPSDKNDDPPWTAIQCCRQYVEKSIEETKPRLIIGLGKFAQQWMLGSTDSRGMRGRLFAVQIGSHRCWFMPVYHPSHVIHYAAEQAKKQGRRNPTQEEMLETVSGRTFKLDIEKACNFIEVCKPPVIPVENEVRQCIIVFDGNGPGRWGTEIPCKELALGSIPSRSTTTQFDELIRLLKYAKIAPHKAIDIETNALRPYSRNSLILSCALSFKDTHISFAIDHPKAGWTSQQKKIILDTLRDIIIDDTIKIAHSAIFECEWFIHYFGKEVIKHKAWECTQLQAHCLDERRGSRQTSDDAENQSNPYQALNFLIKMHFGVPFKEWFKVNRKNIVADDLTETLFYGGADTLFTLRLWGHQTELLRTSGLLNVYKLTVWRQPVMALTQYLGLPVNQTAVLRLQNKLSDQIAVIKAEIESLDVVKEYIDDKKRTVKNFEFNSMGHDSLNIFKDYLERPEIKLSEEQKKKKDRKSDKLGSEKRSRATNKPISNGRLISNPSPIKEDDEDVRYSLDREVLEKIDHPLAKYIITLRNKIKMKSTYVDGLEQSRGPLIYPDGKLHPHFHTTFTTTSRLSSSEPNAQNYPKRADNWIREPIEAPDGYTMVAIDYGQLEMCGAAMCSDDKVLKKYLNEDYDTHMFWAGRLADLCPESANGDFSDPKVAKKLRSMVKNQLVFPAIYGSSNQSVADGLGVDIDIVDILMEEFWGTFKGIKKWQVKTLKKYREHGYVEDLMGRRRHHPLTNNEIINAPIQSVSSNIVIDAMCRLSYIAANEGKWYLHPHLNIHDDLSFFVPKKKAEEAVARIVYEMLTPDFEFIDGVPLSCEVSTGPNWAALEPFDKFSSKDF